MTAPVNEAAAPPCKHVTRRALLASSVAAATVAQLSAAPLPAAATPGQVPDQAPDALDSEPEEPRAAATKLDTSITAKVYLDIAIAPTAFKAAETRTLGDKSILPVDAEPAGRIVIGLYGNLVPITVSNFLTAVKSGALNNTTISRISPGEYVQAGRQGSQRLGELASQQLRLQPNSELSESRAFRLGHFSPGTVSLSLSENDEDPGIKSRPDYRPLEFLITTGPAPVPRLDGLNIVFGRVIEGLDTVATVSRVPSFQPSERSRQLNSFASFIGDERADKVRRKYGKPLKAVIIKTAGVLDGISMDGGSVAREEGARILAAGALLVDVP